METNKASNTTTALTEIAIAKSKADFVLINGKAVVYEIKTELDNLERLSAQVDDNQISPFIEGLDCLEYAINKEHLNKINDEMGKIMRRSDSALDYVPTQYITDFVKSIIHDGVAEYAGIEYESVMHSGGYNLALFDPDLFECVDTKVYGIDMIDYRKHIV